MMETKSMTKRGGPLGPRRGDRKRFPYEARFVGGRLVTPAELQKIHRYVIDTEVVSRGAPSLRSHGKSWSTNCRRRNDSARSVHR